MSRTHAGTTRPGRQAARGWASSGGRNRKGSGSGPGPCPRRSATRSAAAGGGGGSAATARCSDQARAPDVASAKQRHGPGEERSRQPHKPQEAAATAAEEPCRLDREPRGQEQRRPELQGQLRDQVEKSDKREQPHRDPERSPPAPQARDQRQHGPGNNTRAATPAGMIQGNPSTQTVEVAGRSSASGTPRFPGRESPRSGRSRLPVARPWRASLARRASPRRPPVVTTTMLHSGRLRVVNP